MGFDTQKHWNEYFHLYHLGHGKYIICFHLTSSPQIR